MSEQQTSRPHLWEIGHAYYCNEGNYFDNNCGNEYMSFADFLAEEGDSDMDYNLLFRWDWTEETYDDEGNARPVFNGDVNYRNGQLKLFWMGQRKGLYRYTLIEVCRADEPAVIEFLMPRLAHLVGLWLPLQIDGAIAKATWAA